MTLFRATLPLARDWMRQRLGSSRREFLYLLLLFETTLVVLLICSPRLETYQDGTCCHLFCCPCRKIKFDAFLGIVRAMAMDRAASSSSSSSGVKLAPESDAALARFLLLHVVPNLLTERPFALLLSKIESGEPFSWEESANEVAAATADSAAAVSAAATATTSSEPVLHSESATKETSVKTESLSASASVDSTATQPEAAAEESASSSASPATPAKAAPAEAEAHAGSDAKPAIKTVPISSSESSAASADSASSSSESAAVQLLAGSASSPAVGAAARASADRDALSQFLASLNLGRHLPVLAAMGVTSVGGLRSLPDADLQGLGLSATQVRLLRGATDRWLDTMSAMLAERVAPSPEREAAGPASPLQRAAVLQQQLASAASSSSASSPFSPAMLRATGALVSQAVAASVPQRHREAFGITASALSSDGAAAPTQPISSSSSSPPAYDWEEYATPEGYLYYANARSGATQWLRPYEGSIRTLAVRAAEQAAVHAMVEERVRAALAAKRARAAEEEQAAALAQALTARAQRSPSPSSRRTIRSPSPRTLRGGVGSPTRGSPSNKGSPKSSPLRNNASGSASKGYLKVEPASSSLSATASASSGRMVVSPNRPVTRWNADGPSRQQGPVMVVSGKDGSSNTLEHHASGVISSNSSVRTGGGRLSQGALRSTWSEVLGPAGVDVGVGGGSSPRSASGSFLAAQAAALQKGGASISAAEVAKVTGLLASASGMYAAVAATTSSGWKDSTQTGDPGTSPRGGDEQQQQRQTVRHRPASLSRGADGHSIAGYSRASGLTSEAYPDVFESLPLMDPRTADTIVRGNSFATTKRMGYADPRPDVRPSGTFKINPAEQGALALHFPAVGGPQKKADAAWASQLRGHLYAPSADPKAARTGEEMKKSWAGGGLAPSEVVPSYAYRHAAEASQHGGYGSVYDRLTDIRGFTGTHRHRFGEDGRGLGLAGRDGSYDVEYLKSTVQTDIKFGAPSLPNPKDLGPNVPTAPKK